MIRTLIVLAATLALAPAQAAPYTSVQLEASSIGFSFQQMGVKADGRFKKFSSQVSFDPAKAEKSQAKFEIELASVDTGSSEADQEVVSKSWFNTAAFPKASFVSKQIKMTAPNQYEVLGTLSIKGQSREVKFPLKHTPQGKNGLLTGSFSLKRADFAIGEGMWAKFDVVANDIQVNFSITALAGK